MRVDRLKPQYVTVIPGQLEPGILYISKKYQTAVHSCCSGCGVKVVTPFSPGRWTLKDADGAITIRPSIGNGSFKCGSHYLITGGEINWLDRMSAAEARVASRYDRYDVSVATDRAASLLICIKGSVRVLWRWLMGDK